MLTADRQLRDRATGTDQRRPPRPDQPTPCATDPGNGSGALAPRLISLPEVMDRVALKRTSIYELIKTRDFPAPVKIQRASRWVDIEISDWIRVQMSKR
ncbi:helix-turn-helix transcriptional regulator [Ideonella oryzae]|nr:AlpA family phage regulatory protein [Ideonella oryzae]